jgi:hypothetical protein
MYCKRLVLGEPHFVDLRVPMHPDDPQSQQRLVSTNFYSYVCIICFICVELTVVQERHTEELKKKHGSDVDLRSVPFDVDASNAAGASLPHGRYVKCIYHLQLRIINS